MKICVNGHTIAFEDSGSGPAVVLIHGYGMCRKMWKQQQDFFSDSGFRVIAPDLRGFGESGPIDGEYSIPLLADDMIALLNYLGIGRAVFCGMSFGGYVLFDLIDRYPSRVAGACFAMTKATVDSDSEKARRTVVAELFQRGSREAAIEALVPWYAVNQKSIRLPMSLKEVLGWIGNTSSEALARALLAMRDREDYVSKVRSCRLPAVIIGAEFDKVTPPSDSRFLAKILPHAKCRILPGVGHFANMENPTLFNDCLIDFVNGLRDGLAGPFSKDEFLQPT